MRWPGGTPVTCKAGSERVIRRTMRFHAKHVLLLCLAFARPGVMLMVAQNTPPDVAQDREPRDEQKVSSQRAGRAKLVSAERQHASAPRPLSANEGLTILSAALDSRHQHADLSADCSHLVHGIYERAGLSYPYASSSDLYEGTAQFRRVTSPQAGDLVVWPGHSGIVVSPAQHSFFSELRSGPGVDSYDSPYWKQRGLTRFFRYLKLSADDTGSTSLRAASWQPAAVDSSPRDEAMEDSAPPATSSSKTKSPAQVAESRFVSKTAARVLVVNFARPKPDQVRAAFLQACQDSQANVGGADLLTSNQSLVAFGDFEVKRVHLKGNQGWAEVQIEEVASLRRSEAVPQQRSERQQWPLTRRDSASWNLTTPRGAIYVPQSIAVKILARELKRLSEDNGPDTTSRNQQMAELARLLDVLLER